MIPIITLLLTSKAFADGKTEKRNSCIVLKRYVAEAKIKDPDSPFWINDEEKKCSGTAYAFVSAQDYCSGAGPFVAAEVEAQSSAAGESYTEYTLGCTGWTAGSDVKNLLPLYSDFAMYQSKLNNLANKNFVSQGRISSSEILFNETKSEIVIKDLKGYVSVNSQDIYNDYSTFVISIKHYNLDETFEIIWQVRAFVYKGQLVVEGDLNKQLFTTEKLEFGSKYSLNVNELVISMTDKFLVWENLAVEMAVDGGNLGRGIEDEYVINFDSDQVKEIDKETILPNYTFDITQASDNNNIFISMSFNSEELGNIAIHSIDGKLIKVLEAEISINETSQIKNYNISDIPSGMYFVKFESDNILLTRKIIIVR